MDQKNPSQHSLSKLYDLSKQQIPLRAADSKLKWTLELFESFKRDVQAYENQLKKHNQRRLNALGIVAKIGQEYDLAIDLFTRAGNLTQVKLTNWEKSGESLEELIEKLSRSEISQVIGIMVKRKDFEFANKLRVVERNFHRDDLYYSNAAEVSYKMNDWTGLLQDIESDDQFEQIIQTNSLLVYARVSKKHNQEVSSKIYGILKTRARKDRHHSLYAMVCSEIGEFHEAAIYYERAKCFVPAINLRLHLGLPTKPLEIKALEQAFYNERDFLKECFADRFIADSYGNIIQSEQRSMLDYFYKSRRLAKRYRLRGFLSEALRQNGLYFTLERFGEELESSEDFQKEISLMKNITKRLDLNNWGNFLNPQTVLQPFLIFLTDLQSVEHTHFKEDELNPIALFHALGLPEDMIEILILNYINLHSTHNSLGKNCGWDILSSDFPSGHEKLSYAAMNGILGIGKYSPAIFSDFGLDVVRRMFESKRYVPLIEVTPLLIPEFDSDTVTLLKNMDSEYLL